MALKAEFKKSTDSIQAMKNQLKCTDTALNTRKMVKEPSKNHDQPQ